MGGGSSWWGCGCTWAYYSSHGDVCFQLWNTKGSVSTAWGQSVMAAMATKQSVSDSRGDGRKDRLVALIPIWRLIFTYDSELSLKHETQWRELDPQFPNCVLVIIIPEVFWNLPTMIEWLNEHKKSPKMTPKKRESGWQNMMKVIKKQLQSFCSCVSGDFYSRKITSTAQIHPVNNSDHDPAKMRSVSEPLPVIPFTSAPLVRTTGVKSASNSENKGGLNNWAKKNIIIITGELCHQSAVNQEQKYSADRGKSVTSIR